MTGGCTNPPVGWLCSRKAGHTGPCAASPTEQFAGYMDGCPHDEDPSYDGVWCAICNPATGGDRMQGMTPPSMDKQWEWGERRLVELENELANVERQHARALDALVRIAGLNPPGTDLQMIARLALGDED